MTQDGVGQGRQNAASLGSYVVTLASGQQYRFDAEDVEHAREQAQDAEPDDPVVFVRRRIERDYKGVNEQIIVKNLSVLVHQTDEGVVVDIYPLGEEGVDDPIATTYAFWQDVDCEGRPDDSPLHLVESNEHKDAWCGICGERLLLPGYAGGPMIEEDTE